MNTPPHTLEKCSVSEKIRRTGEFYELDFLSAIVQYLRPNTSFLDVGAHIGNHTAYLMQAVPSAHGIAVEANPQTSQILIKNCIDLGLGGRVHVIESAVGAAEGTGELVATNPDDMGTMSLHSNADAGDGVQVKIITIDEALKALEQNPVSVMKIDAEGSECEIIQGATETIKAHRPVICAESRTVGEFEQLGNLLKPLDYSPVAIYNATPTVVWEPREKRLTLSLPPVDPGQAFKYGIEMALEANSLALRLRKGFEASGVASVDNALEKEQQVLLNAKVYQMLNSGAKDPIEE